jgi:hypothetical protein
LGNLTHTNLIRQLPAADKNKEIAMLDQTFEPPVYPVEFLDAIQATAFDAMKDLLEKIEAPKEAICLLEDLATLATLTGQSKHAGEVRPFSNQILMETVASATRNIVELGGVFYSPVGTTIPRHNQV